jgi:hypothetical protein
MGILVFIILYIVAAMLYPGGSDVNQSAVGFSWQHNYWCELMATEAQNGQLNSARPVAISAMFVLAVSLIIFWYHIPLLFRYRKFNYLFIRFFGISSMLVIPFFLVGMHDWVTNIGSLLGCIAIAALLVTLFNYKLYFLFSIGIGCLLLCAVNNYFYYNKELLHHLPILQKITFLVFLVWFILLSLQLYKKWKTQTQKIIA